MAIADRPKTAGKRVEILGAHLMMHALSIDVEDWYHDYVFGSGGPWESRVEANTLRLPHLGRCFLRLGRRRLPPQLHQLLRETQFAPIVEAFANQIGEASSLPSVAPAA